MKAVTINVPNTDAVAAETSPIVAEAAALVITSVADHGAALRIAQRAATHKASIEAMLEPSIKAAHAAHKTLTGLRATLTAPLDEVRQIATRKAMDWDAEQRRRAAEEQRRLEEIARKAEEERQLADAIAASESGDDATAEAILDEPQLAPVVHVEPAVARVQGVATVTRWSAEVVDLLKLAAYVVANPEWVTLISANTVALNALARSQKGALRIPGVRAVEVRDYSVRRTA